MNFAVLDLETNGFKGTSVVSASSIIFDENGMILNFFNRYYYPTEKPDYGAIRVHGLDPSRINWLRKGYSYPQYFSDDWNSLRLFWEHHHVEAITVHNLGFDTSFIPDAAKKERKWCCSMLGLTDFCKIQGKNGQYKWPKLEEAKKITMNTLSAYENVLSTERAISSHICHNSLSDCLDLYSIFMRIWKNRPDLAKFAFIREKFIQAKWERYEWDNYCEPDRHIWSALQLSLEIARLAGLEKKEQKILRSIEDLFPGS